MSHQEKQEIFDRYAKSKGYGDWRSLHYTYLHQGYHSTWLDSHIFAACDLVQAEQQKRIAENVTINFHDGYFKSNTPIKYFQSGSDNLSIDKKSILNPENKIQ